MTRKIDVVFVLTFSVVVRQHLATSEVQHLGVRPKQLGHQPSDLVLHLLVASLPLLTETLDDERVQLIMQTLLQVSGQYHHHLTAPLVSIHSSRVIMSMVREVMEDLENMI